MAASAYHQASFLGGGISPLSEGRSDLPFYRQALSVNMNAIITESGAWTRRSGLQFIAKTHDARFAKMLPFYSSTLALDLLMEFTDGSVRFFNGTSICFTEIQGVVTASSFAAGVLSLTVSPVTGFAAEDDIMLWSPPTLDPAKIQAFRGRVMRVTAVVGSVLTVKDEAANAFVGLSSTANDLIGTIVYQVARLGPTSWSGSDVLAALRVVQVPNVSTGSYAQILTHTVSPRNIKVSAGRVVTTAAEAFIDGPYLDQQGTFEVPETGTVSGYSGSITFTPLTSTFVAADVGRHIRLFNQPPAWAVGTTYAFRDVVTYNGAWWTSTGTGTYAANLGNIPGTPGTFSGTQVTVWAAAPEQGVWAWGTITAQAGASCTVSLVTPLKSANGATIAIWRLGVYTAGQYPTCGVWHDGRLWHGGAMTGRFDASMSNNPLAFSPTEANGTVNDNNGISYTINGVGGCTILWMATDKSGILVGTPIGVGLIHPLVEGALTPTNTSFDWATETGCGNREPVRTPMALAYIQRYHLSLLELMPEGLTSGRFVDRSLNVYARHYADTGIEAIAYQHETVPILWACMVDGSLASCTYRRTSRFVTEDPVVQAWGENILGGNYAGDIVRPARGICVLPSPQGETDNLYVMSASVDDDDHFIGVMRPVFETA